MATILIQNPNDTSVDVRVLKKGGFFGLGKVDELIHVSASSFGSLSVPEGKYSIRYKYVDSDSVWEGDSFSVDESATAQITLQMRSDGNYGVRPVSGHL